MAGGMNECWGGKEPPRVGHQLASYSLLIIRFLDCNVYVCGSCRWSLLVMKGGNAEQGTDLGHYEVSQADIV